MRVEVSPAQSRQDRPDGVARLMPSWAAALGRQHGARARDAQLASQATHTAAVESASTALSRWPRIVDAMTRLVAAYNTGFESETLHIAEDLSIPSRPVVTIRAAGADAPALVVTLEESMICTRRSDSGDQSCETEYRLRADRGDDETAAYVLQHWMEHL